MIKPPTLVFTGGHHTSALVVARILNRQGYTIVWFGHRRSMWGDKSDSAEYKDVTHAGFDFYDLQAGKLFRTFNPLKLIRLPWGFFQALFWLLKLKLDADLLGIVSFGGYLAVPTVISGWSLGIPSVTHEQTLVSGWANRTLGFFVRKIALTWASSQPFYPPGKTVVTGLPLRPAIVRLARAHPPQTNPGRPVIFIMGGKQGSHLLNLVVFKVLSRLTPTYDVIHQTGSSSLFNDYSTASSFANPHYHPFTYDSRKTETALGKASVFIGRAGAHTIYELAALRKKAVLIPIPWVSHNEQHLNAEMLVRHHQAIIIPEAQLTPDSLMSAIKTAISLPPSSISVPLDGSARLVQLIKQSLL